MGKSSTNGSFSMAMLNNQRVNDSACGWIPIWPFFGRRRRSIPAGIHEGSRIFIPIWAKETNTDFSGLKNPWQEKNLYLSNIVKNPALGDRHMAQPLCGFKPQLAMNEACPGPEAPTEPFSKTHCIIIFRWNSMPPLVLTLLVIVVPNIPSFVSFKMFQVAGMPNLPKCAVAHPVFGDPGMNNLDEMACFHKDWVCVQIRYP